MIEIQHLEKYYNKGKKQEVHVLQDINLTFDSTGLVCILGESGSGKTTLLNAIGGLDDFSGGSIQVENARLTGYDPKQIEDLRNNHFGYIFQNYYLLSDYSVEYNIGLALSRYDLSEDEKNQRIDQVLAMLDMSKYKHKLVSKLSGGQQQRISIARAVVKTPNIILADEPTGNLDEENTLRTMSILKNLSKDCLVLLVTHERRIARFFADRIIEVSDGQIIRDESNTASLYQRSDDSNLYLKTMEYTTLSNDFATFNLYHNREELPSAVNLNLVWQNGKLYIQNTMNYDLVLEGPENGFQIVDAQPPALDMEEVDAITYDLPKLPDADSAKLSFQKALHMAVTNLQQAGKKQAFISLILLAAAMMLSLTLAQFMNTVSMDADAITSTDSHYMQADFKNVSIFHTNEQLQVFDFAQNYLCEGPVNSTLSADSAISTDRAISANGSAFYAPDVKLYLIGQGFSQLEKVKQQLPKYCYASLSHLSKEDLTYGRMPKTRTEVVLDKKVIQALIDSQGVLSSQLSSMEDYLGSLLKTAVSTTTLTIVGICDTGEPDVYCGQNVLLAFSTKGYRLASLSELQAEDADIYGSTQLQDNELLLREGLYRSLSPSERNSYVIGDDKTHTYEIAGTIPDTLGVDYVLTDSSCVNIRDLMIYENRTFLIYTEDKTATRAYLEEAQKENMKSFSLEITIPYDTEILEYQAAHTRDFGATYLIAGAICVISLLMIYFTMKSNALARCEELTVYRLLGIAKSSIIKSYVLETLLLTSFTSLPAVLLTSFGIWFIGRIPSLETDLLFTWWSVILLLALIYLVHALVSTLPIRKILALPPAALALKD